MSDIPVKQKVVVEVELFKVTQGKMSVYMRVEKDDSVTIRPCVHSSLDEFNCNKETFLFKKSKPECIKAMAELFLEALNVAEEYNMDRQIEKEN